MSPHGWREGALPPRWRGHPPRRDRQAAAQPHAGPLPPRRAPVRRGRRGGGASGARGPAARRAPPRQAHHPRDHADLRHARAGLPVHARGGQGRSGVSAPRRPGDQRPPGRHPQLPAEPRVQPVVHGRRGAGLAARPPGHARRHGRAHRRGVDPSAAHHQALQDPHGPRDGEGHGRARRRRRGGRAAGARPDRPLRRGHRDDPGHAGPDERAAGRLRAGRGAARRDGGGGPAPAPLAAGARRLAPRGGDPLPPPRRLLGERDGRVGGARGRDPRDRQADGRLPRPLPLLPAADLRRLALLRVHHGPRALEGGVRRHPRLDRRADRHRRPGHPLLEHGVQEGPDALLHGGLRALGTGARALTTSLTDLRSAELYRRAVHVLPGGVNSPVRAMRAIERDAVFIERAEGAEITDVDGNTYVDYVCSWGPLIHGHAHPAIVAAVTEAAGRGTSYGAPTAGEVELAELVAQRMPGVDMLRMTSSGTEASMSAIRLARAATGREMLLKFAGAYHGHVDGLLAQAGSGLATHGLPASPGVPESAAAATVIVPWNDADAVRAAFAEHDLAAVLAEPYPANMGLVPPEPGFLQLLRELATEHGALLVFDEVITGFRVSAGGAQ